MYFLSIYTHIFAQQDTIDSGTICEAMHCMSDKWARQCAPVGPCNCVDCGPRREVPEMGCPVSCMYIYIYISQCLHCLLHNIDYCYYALRWSNDFRCIVRV